MPEDLTNIQPTERIKQTILDTASCTNPEEKSSWTEVQRAHAIANALPPIFGISKCLNDIDPRFKQWAEYSFQVYATSFGISVEELLPLCIKIKEELRSILPEKEWQAYFGESYQSIY